MDALRRELETEGFHVFNLSGARSRYRLPFVSRSEKVAGQDFLLFNTQLKTLLHAGMPLAQSLELLKDQQTSPHFRALLDKVHQQVTTGVALSDAFLTLGCYLSVPRWRFVRSNRHVGVRKAGGTVWFHG